MRNILGKLKGRLWSLRYGWFGNYSTWEEAKAKCTGYDADLIFEKVKTASLKVLRNEAVYERDSVAIYKQEYKWPLVASLFYAAGTGGTLHITDFGGSMGSLYHQHKTCLTRLTNVKWGVVEQPHFVDFAKANCVTGDLSFYYSAQECLAQQEAHVLLLSGVVQYLEEPHLVISSLLALNYQYIYIDRTAFIRGFEDRLTIQRVPTSIYKASYPSWFFNEIKFLNQFLGDYKLIFEFENTDFCNLKNGYFKGFLFEKKNIQQ